MKQPLVLGIDIGTSGVRTIALDQERNTIALEKASFQEFNGNLNDPKIWLEALHQTISNITSKISIKNILAICIDGTSGTVLALDKSGHPIGKALMYNDVVTDDKIVKTISDVAPLESAVHGSSSALARAISLQSHPQISRIVHQADWIAEQFTGQPIATDESNALKTGYDPIKRKWPEWLNDCGINLNLLPQVIPTGSLLAKSNGAFKLPIGIPVVSGTTDGCASFIATGASQSGDGVTILGSTLTIKLLSNRPIFSPKYGIYSHRIGEQWLAGGASNSGGNALATHFSPDQIESLSKKIDPLKPSGFDYYPLPKVGERFPINDPNLQPRISPRPSEPSLFLHGLFEGLAQIEQTGYSRLQELGGPNVNSIRTIGGGANNQTLTKIRSRFINVPNLEIRSNEAAAGVAEIAWRYLENRN